jgi:high-affinity nickel-transport protein
VSRQRNVRGAALTGIFWGVGHTLTLVVVGGAIIFFGLVIPERLGLSFEFCVALMLILLGALNLRAIKHGIQEAAALVTHHAEHLSHVHPHQHGDYIHEHSHGHEPGKHGHAGNAVPPARLDRFFGRLGIYQTFRPVVIGVVHGLAGSAGVALLVLPIIHDPVWVLAYLLIFGVGTIAGMMLITSAIAVPITCSANRFQLLNRYLGATASVVSVAFGVFLAYQIGFVDGLFSR